eukprot:768005-Hanusia_phi.AAC.5
MIRSGSSSHLGPLLSPPQPSLVLPPGVIGPYRRTFTLTPPPPPSYLLQRLVQTDCPVPTVQVRSVLSAVT